MKIRSVKITNFRKFVGTHGVDGITDGVNVLVGRNELGKSTLLAAINGVIFEKAKSKTTIVESFRHHVTTSLKSNSLSILTINDGRFENVSRTNPGRPS
jgi:predicted ATP-dependent endonuclease of OLD family